VLLCEIGILEQLGVQCLLQSFVVSSGKSGRDSKPWLFLILRIFEKPFSSIWWIENKVAAEEKTHFIFEKYYS
jgi:hypothetical protein